MACFTFFLGIRLVKLKKKSPIGSTGYPVEIKRQIIKQRITTLSTIAIAPAEGGKCSLGPAANLPRSTRHYRYFSRQELRIVSHYATLQFLCKTWFQYSAVQDHAATVLRCLSVECAASNTNTRINKSQQEVVSQLASADNQFFPPSSQGPLCPLIRTFVSVYLTHCKLLRKTCGPQCVLLCHLTLKLQIRMNCTIISKAVIKLTKWAVAFVHIPSTALKFALAYFRWDKVVVAERWLDVKDELLKRLLCGKDT